MVRAGTVVRTFSLCGLALTTLAFAKTNEKKTSVTHSSGFAISQPVSELPVDYSLFVTHVTPEPKPLPLRFKKQTGPVGQEDPVLQKETLPAVAATVGISFDGIPSPGYAPSDSNLAVGPNHIVETVNVQYAVYSKTGTLLAGPTNIQTLFQPLGGNCAGTFGDPVVLYDRPADRWVISYIGSGSSAAECVAVSKTNDPTGAYYLYGYSFGSNLNDYPKLSTWATTTNSAYLATYNIFLNGQTFGGADLCGFDRTKMQAGDKTATMLCKRTPNTEGGYLPSDIDGPTTPADGTPGLFITWQNNNPGQLFLRKLTLNFAAGTATMSSPTTISTANTSLACGSGGTCVPQSGTTETLDTLGDRMMYRFAIRHFADHDRAVVQPRCGEREPGRGSLVRNIRPGGHRYLEPAGNLCSGFDLSLDGQHGRRQERRYRTWLQCVQQQPSSGDSVHRARADRRCRHDGDPKRALWKAPDRRPAVCPVGAITPRCRWTPATIARSGMWTNTRRRTEPSTGAPTSLRSLSPVAAVLVVVQPLL